MTDKQLYNVGRILILFGALTIFAKIGLFNGMPGIIGAAFLALGGGIFGRMYFVRNQLWALFVSAGFFGAAAAAISGELAGAYFLGILGSGFAYAYFRNKKHWWAIIPAGILATLAIIVGIAVSMPFSRNRLRPFSF